MARFKSAEIVAMSDGRQYHIDLAPDEVAPYCLFCGDPARAERIARSFDAVRVERRNREYVSFTGTYRGAPLTVMSTGIGCDNTEIAVIEYCQLIEGPTFLRIGSCGALRPEVRLGELIVSTGAVKLENTTSFFVVDGYPAVADREVTLAVIEACEAEKLTPYHVGLTASASGFYGAQGRKVPGFPVRYPDLPAELERMNVVNFEMETSALFILSNLRGVRAGCVCAAYANRHHNVFIDTETKERAEAGCIRAGLGAVEVLRRMDAARAAAGGVRHWRPSLGLGLAQGGQ